MFPRDGFQITNDIAGVTTLTSCVRINDIENIYNFEDHITSRAIYDLANEIINKKLYSITKFNNDYTFKINIVNSDIKYVNKQTEKFIVAGEVFTNDELVKAVKNTFPERII